ncbi:MAG: hypothetical protein ACXW3Z_03420 [Limisphaerales bacterium]
MKSVRTLITVLAVGAMAFGIYYFLFPPAEKVIRKRLTRLAEAISSRPQGNIATMANVNRIGSFFHPNVSITVEGFGTELASVQGRGELTQVALAARQRPGGISVEFYNVEINVSGKTNATATATAMIKLNDDPNANVQDVQLAFEKYDRDWLIRSAAPSKSLKLQ